MRAKKQKQKLSAGQIVGWKNHALAAVCLLIGLWAFSHGNVDGGMKAALAGLALITLRDVFSKVLCAVEGNRQSMDDLRAIIETELSSRKGGR